MTGSVYDQDTDTWEDEDGNFAAAITNVLILTAAAGLIILFVVNTVQFVWGVL